MVNNWKPKQFSLNVETVQKIDELAELLDRKKSNIVKLAIDEYYKKQKKILCNNIDI